MTTAAPRRVAIVHYHFRAGGVRSVAAHAAGALREAGIQVVFLAGEPDGGQDLPAPLRVVDGLAYDARRGGPELARDLIDAATAALGAPPDLWHVHNHALGKNLSLPAAVAALAEREQPLLLQIHDFAEDGRPANFRRLADGLGAPDLDRLGRVLYPRGPSVRYAVLTARDRDLLCRAGMPGDRVEVLANPVVLNGAEEERGDGRESPLFLYPTRAIRRKNLGEFLLWAACAGPDRRFAVTLAPDNPAARRVYEGWVAAARRLSLPVAFDYGAAFPGSFPEMIASCRATVTTSVAEGFGLAFLEPWLGARPVVGRNLPEITADFAAVGVDLSMLYDRLDVPLAWAGDDRFRQALQQGLRASRERYGRTTDGKDVERAYRAAVAGGRVDFGRLDEALQERVLERLAGAEEERCALAARLYRLGPADDAVDLNRRVISEHYGLERYRRRLLEVYARVVGGGGASSEAFSLDRLLDGFLDPARFYLLRT